MYTLYILPLSSFSKEATATTSNGFNQITFKTGFGKTTIEQAHFAKKSYSVKVTGGARQE